MIACHGNDIESFEGTRQRVDAELLPRAARRRVVTEVEQDVCLGGARDFSCNGVHTDVVVPVGDDQRCELTVLGFADLRRCRTLLQFAVETRRRLVRGDRALDDRISGLAGTTLRDFDPVEDWIGRNIGKDTRQIDPLRLGCAFAGSFGHGDEYGGRKDHRSHCAHDEQFTTARPPNQHRLAAFLAHRVPCEHEEDGRKSGRSDAA